MSTEVATTGSFTGADVDGLDHLAQEFNGAAEIVDMVKMACEVIVAAASIFGPFGAAFVAYLKGTVIPWLTKVSAALKAMSKVLSLHSSAQKDASSSTTLPSYTGTSNLPATSTLDAPALPAATNTAVIAASPTTPTGTTVAAPPTIGGTTPTTSGTPSGTTAAAGVTPFVSAVTALTGLVTAVDHLIHPGSATSTAPTTPPTDPGATPPTDPGTPTPTVPPTDPGTTPTTPTDPGTTPTSPTTPVDPGTTPPTGTTPVLGSTGGIGGIDLSTLHPLHPGDSVGVLSIPVDIAPDGTVTPLIHTPLDPAPTTTPIAPSTTIGDPAAPAAIAPSSQHAAVPISSSGGSGGSDGGGTGGGPGGGTGGGSGGGSDAGAPVITSAPPADAVTTAAHAPVAPAGPATSQAEPGLRTETIGSHDGLFTGMGQATGIGAGAAALARAVLSEARQNGNGSVLGAVPLPFDADADGAAQTEIYQGSIG